LTASTSKRKKKKGGGANVSLEVVIRYRYISIMKDVQFLPAEHDNQHQSTNYQGAFHHSDVYADEIREHIDIASAEHNQTQDLGREGYS
jgi:hypothetical protein